MIPKSFLVQQQLQSLQTVVVSGIVTGDSSRLLKDCDARFRDLPP
jgi:hypothetical protein